MFYPDWYRDVSARFRDDLAVQAINVLDKALVGIIAAIYVILIVMTVVTGQFLQALRIIAVPAITFGLVTYLRDRIDAPRPYELYEIDPIIVKNTHGKSMPSRHVASAFIIACAITWVHPDWGAIAFIASVIVAFTRIIGGVHFPKDVAAAVAISLACGFIGFVLIP